MRSTRRSTRGHASRRGMERRRPEVIGCPRRGAASARKGTVCPLRVTGSLSRGKAFPSGGIACPLRGKGCPTGGKAPLLGGKAPLLGGKASPLFAEAAVLRGSGYANHCPVTFSVKQHSDGQCYSGWRRAGASCGSGIWRGVRIPARRDGGSVSCPVCRPALECDDLSSLFSLDDLTPLVHPPTSRRAEKRRQVAALQITPAFGSATRRSCALRPDRAVAKRRLTSKSRLSAY